jgi:hypothetical protein
MSRWEGVDLIPAMQEISETYAALMKLQLSFVFPCAFVSYERLVADPKSGVCELAKWLGVSDDQAIANAVQFVSSDGYRPVSNDSHTGITDEDELARDRANGQTALYGKRIAELEDLVARTREDLNSATLHQQNHVNLVVKNLSALYGNHLPWRGIVNLSLPEIIALLPDSADSNLHADPTQAQVLSPGSDSSLEVQVNLSEMIALARANEAAYRALSSEYGALALRRIQLQQDLDSLQDKMIALTQGD